jgi:hypothetical protein
MKFSPASSSLGSSVVPTVSMESISKLPDATQPTSGALAFVPFGGVAGSETLLHGFRAVARKQGPVAGIQWLVQNSGPLKALIKTPAGRASLAAATLGAIVGWTVGSNAQKAQALAVGLKAISDQNLPADQTARQVGQMLQEAMFGRQRIAAPPKGNTNTNWPASTQPVTLEQLRIKLGQAKQRLTESKELSRQSPRDPDLPKIIQAQTAVVAQLQAKVNALERAQAPVRGSGATRPRQKVPVVPPIPTVPERTSPVVPVEKLPRGKPPPKTNPLIDTKRRITRPPSPEIPPEFDPSEIGKQKVLDRAGEVTRRQRADRYQRGGNREDALDGLTGNLRGQVEADIDKIDNAKLPPGGATGGRKTETTAGAADDAKPVRVTRRSKAERLRGMGRKILKERFDGKNVSARFISTVQRAGDHATTAATPARDNDLLTSGSPATVGDVKKMLGGLNNSIISIKKLPMGLVVVTVESKGFRAISLMLRTSSKGIDEITVGEISTGGSRTPERNAATNEVMPNLDTRQPLVGALLALKICEYAEQNSISSVLALAAVGPANSENGDLATQGARVWPTVGLDGPIGEVNVVRIQKFLRNHPEVAEKSGLRSVTGRTRVLDLVADPTGKLIPEAMEFWRASPNSYDGRVDLSNQSSRSYLIYRRALEDYGLK